MESKDVDIDEDMFVDSEGGIAEGDPLPPHLEKGEAPACGDGAGCMRACSSVGHPLGKQYLLFNQLRQPWTDRNGIVHPGMDEGKALIYVGVANCPSCVLTLRTSVDTTLGKSLMFRQPKSV